MTALPHRAVWHVKGDGRCGWGKKKMLVVMGLVEG